MSGVSPPTATGSAAPEPASADGADPSMEEILASIRRILNDDDVPAEPVAAKPAVAEDDVLILDETMMVPDAPSDVFETAPTPDVATHEPVSFEPVVVEQVAPEPVPPPVPVQEIEASPAPQRDDAAATLDLLGPVAAAAAASSVETLIRTLTAGRATQVYAGGPTLEDMVRAELRPMLKVWLDTYLPPMVERLVRVEIERVVGRVVP